MAVSYRKSKLRHRGSRSPERRSLRADFEMNSESFRLSKLVLFSSEIHNKGLPEMTSSGNHLLNWRAFSEASLISSQENERSGKGARAKGRELGITRS